MLYSVHIYSEFEAIVFDNNIYKCQVNSKFGYHLNINTENNNTLLVYSAQSFYGYKFLPYIIDINEIIFKNNNNLVQVKNYIGTGKSVCELILKPNLIPDSFLPAIKEKNINIDKKNFNICVFADRVEINNIKFCYKNFFNIANVSIQVINKYIVIINSNKYNYYVLIIGVYEGIMQQHYEDIVNKIEINNKENKIKILKKHNKFYQTGKVEEIVLENEFDIKEQYFVKLGSMNKNLNSNLIPYAFMHCVMLKDYNFAKNFLCTELKNKLSPTTLSAYFENLVDFEKCKYCEQENILFVKYKNEENYKPLKFVLHENKIVDMK